MKKILVFLIVFLLRFGATNNLVAAEINTSFGVWDWKHFENAGSGAYAINFDYQPDDKNRNLNIPILGDVKKIYSLTLYADFNDSFSKKYNIRSSENTSELGGFISAGIEKEFKVFEKLTLIPSFAPSLYGRIDEGKNMGLPLEFKSQVKIRYDFSNSSNFILSYNHLSNANIGNWNPGSDTILFSFKIYELF